jgi:hypothetical protein
MAQLLGGLCALCCAAHHTHTHTKTLPAACAQIDTSPFTLAIAHRSLGCVFYELTAQRPAFNAFNITGLVTKIQRNKLPPLPDTYSAAWRGIIAL